MLVNQRAKAEKVGIWLSGLEALKVRSLYIQHVLEGRVMGLINAMVLKCHGCS